ncbi:hypothetical protein, partial [Salmonella sp. s51944]|uniref:hypothetical protein n=1 Tax=Salmonella sp. s51944 TaxID=3159655 RepID=UPI0039807222
DFSATDGVDKPEADIHLGGPDIGGVVGGFGFGMSGSREDVQPEAEIDVKAASIGGGFDRPDIDRGIEGPKLGGYGDVGKPEIGGFALSGDVEK